MRMRTAMAGWLLATAAPVMAGGQDPLASITDPADRAVMEEAAPLLAGRPDLARLDVVLAKLPRPTPLRGMVQTMRAGVLAGKERVGDAVAAIEEALRLLPDDPRPKLVAAQIFTFTGSPGRAADLWMQASLESPDLARMSDAYVMWALSGRLLDLGDRERADRINARLGELGFSAAKAPERSNAAIARVRNEVRAGQADLALQSVAAIADPGDLLTLYIDRRYEALWPRIAEWATPTLAGQSKRYLEELRGDWVGADDFDHAAPYARRLAELGAYPAVVSLFLPMFDRVAPDRFPPGAEFLAPIVARSLARVGRAGEGRSLLGKVGAAMPQNDSGADLNILGATLLLDANELNWTATLTQADAFLARARQLGPTVNTSATTQVAAMRACALSKLGREAEAQVAGAQVLIAEAVMPSSAMQLHLCRGDAAPARALVVRRLDDERTRDWALGFVQPTSARAETPFSAQTEAVAALVRTAPEVRAAAEKVGRILPQPVLTGLPDGFDPFRARPTTRPLGPNTI